MKKLILILSVLTMIFAITGCKDDKKDLFLPEAKNDKLYTTVGGENNNGQKKSEKASLTVTANGDKSSVEAALHEANGNVYIVSWEYPKNADEYVKSELASIAESFEIKKSE